MDEEDTTYAKLTPVNPEAKLSFHTLAAALMGVSQTTTRKVHCYVHPDPQYDPDVARYRCRALSPALEHDNGDTSTELDSDAESNLFENGMIWTGHYVFSLQIPPEHPLSGWLFGLDKDCEFLAPQVGKVNDSRGRHAVFNLHHETGYVQVFSRASQSGMYKVVVGEERLGPREMRVLNKQKTRLNLGSFEYDFEYTRFAKTARFASQRKAYMSKFLGVYERNFDLTPTPSFQARTIGRWTISSNLAMGTFGKVYSATDPKGTIVAIKIVNQNSRTQAEVTGEIQVLTELTKLAKADNEDRILHLMEAIHTGAHENFKAGHFEDVALVFEQCVEMTFGTLILPISEAYKRGRLPGPPNLSVLTIYKDALMGVEWLHSKRHVHRDLKPENIGILKGRAILLDAGGAMHLKEGESAPPTPGFGGTVAYMAPEREMQEYGFESDVWSMAIVAYTMLLGHHPFRFNQNPWRPGNERLRDEFHSRYNAALEILRNADKLGWCEGLGGLIVNMLRHEWAATNNRPRISIEAVLSHPSWRVLEDEPTSKKPKTIQQD